MDGKVVMRNDMAVRTRLCRVADEVEILSRFPCLHVSVLFASHLDLVRCAISMTSFDRAENAPKAACVTAACRFKALHGSVPRMQRIVQVHARKHGEDVCLDGCHQEFQGSDGDGHE